MSQTGLMKVEGFSDPDDYVEIESGVIYIVCSMYIKSNFCPPLHTHRLWSAPLSGVHAVVPHTHHPVRAAPRGERRPLPARARLSERHG